MMAIVLLLVGLLLVFMEFYLPGAVLGITGGVLIFASIVVFATEFPGPLYLISYIIVTSILVGLVIKYALWKIRSAKPEKSIYSDSAQEGYQASSYDKSVIGKVGITVTDLKPGGYILVEGKRLQALSQSGYIIKDSEVEIIGGQGESLLVKTKRGES